MIQSKFKLKVYFPLVLVIALTTLIIWNLVDFEKTFTSLGGGIFVVTLLISLNLFIIVAILKTQYVALNNEHITIKNFLGWGIDKQQDNIKTFGYYKSSFQYQGKVDNIIYIVKGNKKLAKLSDFYHLNFAEMEHFLENNLTYQGTVHTNIFSDFKSVINSRDKI